MTINEVLVSGFKEFPQFTYCGVDLFGPFTDKNYKKELRRYGVMFTCLCSCAIHIETAYSLETDSFFAWWDPTMAPTSLRLSRSFEKPSRRWIIIKYHICKHTQSLLKNMDQKPIQSKLHEWGLGTRFEQHEASWTHFSKHTEVRTLKYYTCCWWKAKQLSPHN